MNFLILVASLVLSSRVSAQEIDLTNPNWNADSLLMRIVAHHIDSVLTFRGIDKRTLRVITLDPSQSVLTQQYAQQGDKQGDKVLIVDSVHAFLSLAPDNRRSLQYRLPVTLLTQGRGEKLFMIDTIPFGVAREATLEQFGRHGYLIYDRGAPAEEGVWQQVVMPVLVTLGGAAIVALFFLIRS